MCRRRLSLLVLASLALGPGACRDHNPGAVKVVVVGGAPRLRDPATAPLSAPDAVLLGTTAQGLVRFDSTGNIVAGLAESWAVTDDGLSYIFRLAAGTWPNGRKITAEQVARALKRSLSGSSVNPLKDTLGAVDDIVAMTDKVIEIRLRAPRPNLLALLAQPEFAVVRNGSGGGPFALDAKRAQAGELWLTREIVSADEDTTSRQELQLSGATAEKAVQLFAAGGADLVLGGTFADLPYAQRVRLPRGSLRFDPASGLFGLVPVRSGGGFDDPAVRQLLSQAIDRDGLVDALRVPGLVPRATVLEPGLEGLPAPAQPPWFATPVADRAAELSAEAARQFGADRPTIRLFLPVGPGADVLFNRLSIDWGALGLTVERANSPAAADFRLVDAIAPSTSPAWFLRQFRCQSAPVCDKDADTLLDAARDSLIPAQRGALLAQAAARIDGAQLFIPLAAPIRWSLVSGRIEGFAGNRYARHTLTDLDQKQGL
jgi:peptide/nickel transport system substrate-binding protein